MHFCLRLVMFSQESDGLSSFFVKSRLHLFLMKAEIPTSLKVFLHPRINPCLFSVLVKRYSNYDNSTLPLQWTLRRGWLICWLFPHQVIHKQILWRRIIRSDCCDKYTCSCKQQLFEFKEFNREPISKHSAVCCAVQIWIYLEFKGKKTCKCSYFSLILYLAERELVFFCKIQILFQIF